MMVKRECREEHWIEGSSPSLTSKDLQVLVRTINTKELLFNLDWLI